MLVEAAQVGVLLVVAQEDTERIFSQLSLELTTMLTLVPEAFKMAEILLATTVETATVEVCSVLQAVMVAVAQPAPLVALAAPAALQ